KAGYRVGFILPISLNPSISAIQLNTVKPMPSFPRRRESGPVGHLRRFAKKRFTVISAQS
ncbi:hypothetical protein LJ384_002214, partial [Neisseria gonorrhoeae]